MKLVFVLFISTKKSVEQFRFNVDKIRQECGKDATVIVWDFHEYLLKTTIAGNAHVLSSPGCSDPLSKVSDFLKQIPSVSDQSILVFLSSDVALKDKFVELVTLKIEEHDLRTDLNVLTSVGFRIFPHSKSTSHAFMEGIHWKRYGESCTDRGVHILSNECCVIPLRVLMSVSRLYENDNNPAHCNRIWLSFLMSKMDVHIWKVKTDRVLTNQSESPIKKVQGLVQSEEIFYSLYSDLYDLEWPKGVSSAPHCSDCDPSSPTQIDCHSLWSHGFCGVNMQIHPASELDILDAVAYGIKVIRVGAVADAKDLTYLLNPDSQSAEEDEIHLLQVLPYLRSALVKAGSKGLKVIITMVDLPGCNFHSGSCETFWKSSDCRIRIVKFWGTMVRQLADLHDIIMGYDIINEPYTMEDTECDYFDDMPMAHTDILNQFYQAVVKEIRKVDCNVAIILKGLWFSSPRAFGSLVPINDENIYYGFHAYIPPLLCLPRVMKDNYHPKYPGKIRKWLNFDEEILVDRKTIKQLLLDTVYSWQLQYDVPSSHILVAEFGICREVQGANKYLADLIDIFAEFKWSWLMFSFRDEEWDALDYELGDSRSNMLYRSSKSELFETIMKKLKK